MKNCLERKKAKMIIAVNRRSKAKLKYLCDRCRKTIIVPKRISVDSKFHWHLCNACFLKLKRFINGLSEEFLNGDETKVDDVKKMEL